jgi:hypothetical protein
MTDDTKLPESLERAIDDHAFAAGQAELHNMNFYDDERAIARAALVAAIKEYVETVAEHAKSNGYYEGRAVGYDDGHSDGYNEAMDRNP